MGDNEPVCIADEVPFEIPDSWEWVRLGSILTKLTDGTHSTPHYTNSGTPFISVKDISSGMISFENTKFISQEEHKELFKRCDPIKGDIILSKIGTTGIPVLVDTDREFSLFVSVALLKFNHQFIYAEYLVKVIQSPLVQLQCTENTKGVGNKNWVMRDIANTLVCIPPLAEQQRIVSKIEELIPYIDKYDIAYTKLLKLNKDFPEQLKKSILQDAVQGKLVPQDENDEPATALLERIKEEKLRLIKEGKIKKDKQKSVIFKRDNSHYERIGDSERCIDDEIPFEIPDSWVWCRLGNVFQHNTGKALNSSNREGMLRKYITTSNVYWDSFKLDSIKEMYFSNSEIEKCSIQKGDLLVCEGGDVGRSAIWKSETIYCIQNHIHRLRSYQPVSKKYFLNLLYLYKQIGLLGGQGIGIKGLSSNALHMILCPLPPLSEQKRIVTQIEKLLKLNELL